MNARKRKFYLSGLLILTFIYFYGDSCRSQKLQEPEKSFLNLISIHLKKHFPLYENVTYGGPYETYLLKNDWLIQTPDIWGTTLEKYNLGFIPAASEIMDPDFFVPTCNNSPSNCAGISVCATPQYAPDKKLCLTKAHKILEEIYGLITNAKTSVDIITLTPLATSAPLQAVGTGAFSTVLNRAFVKLSESGRAVTVRIMEGSFIPVYALTQSTALPQPSRIYGFLENLQSQLPKNNHLTISVGTMRSCNLLADYSYIGNCGNYNDQGDIALSMAYNHGKIINVDSKTIFTGGENLFGPDYLETSPVNDLNVKIMGATANGATIYQNVLWQYVKNNPSWPTTNYCYTSSIGDKNPNGTIEKSCPDQLNLNSDFQAASTFEDIYHLFMTKIKSMYVSKLTNGVLTKAIVPDPNDADQAASATVFVFTQATKSIKILQQALYNKSYLVLPPFTTSDSDCGTGRPCNIINAIAYAIHFNKVKVDIVTSQFGAGSYSSNVDYCYIYGDVLSKMMQYNIPRATAVNELKESLHLASIQYAKDETINSTANHAKFWMVDDQIFSVGSHNLYPASLQEFSVLIEDQTAVQTLLNQFWNPLWENALHFDLNRC